MTLIFFSTLLTSWTLNRADGNSSRTTCLYFSWKLRLIIRYNSIYFYKIKFTNKMYKIFIGWKNRYLTFYLVQMSQKILLNQSWKISKRVINVSTFTVTATVTVKVFVYFGLERECLLKLLPVNTNLRDKISVYKMFFSTVSHFPDAKDDRIDILPFLEACKGIVRFVGKFDYFLSTLIILFYFLMVWSNVIYGKISVLFSAFFFTKGI